MSNNECVECGKQMQADIDEKVCDTCKSNESINRYNTNSNKPKIPLKTIGFVILAIVIVMRFALGHYVNNSIYNKNVNMHNMETVVYDVKASKELSNEDVLAFCDGMIVLADARLPFNLKVHEIITLGKKNKSYGDEALKYDDAIKNR